MSADAYEAPWTPRWLGRLSHDLRNELVPLRTATDLLSRGRLDAEGQREMLAMIDRQTRRLVRMLDDVSEYGRLLAGNASRGNEPVFMALALDDALAEVEARRANAGQRIVQALPDDPVCVRGDSRRLTSLLQRLLDNALRFSPPGEAVEVMLHVEDGHAVLRVRDRGPGIDPAQLEEIFAPPMEHRSSEGLGLSLLLARGWARLHDGDLAVVPGEGKGACLVLRLPCDPA